jgi:hypothetical protein
VEPFGAFDTSTFTTNPDGSSNHQLSWSDGTLYWIPAIDELFKAFYCDPNRYGSGAGGYWLCPQSSDAAPRIGPPTQGGTTNAGIEPEFRDQYFQVGSYPHATTPWGLLDASGGYSEWTESIAGDTFGRGRAAWGSSVGMGEGFMRQFDRFDFPQLVRLVGAPAGIRVASSVPAPSVVPVAVIVSGFGVGSRRRFGL